MCVCVCVCVCLADCRIQIAQVQAQGHEFGPQNTLKKRVNKQANIQTYNQTPPKKFLSESVVGMESYQWLEPTLSGWRLSLLGDFPCHFCTSGVQSDQDEEGEVTMEDRTMYGELQGHCDI